MNIKILVVEDSQVDMTMIRGILSDYELLSAYDGLEAMEQIGRASCRERV